MATVGLGVTIGNHSLRAVKLRKKGEGFVVQNVFSDRLDEDTASVAGRALAARGLKGSPANVGLTGRDVIIRYTQIPPVPDWRLRTLMKFEVEEVSSQSGGDVSADYRKLELPDPDGERSDDTVLVALARNRHLERQMKSLQTGGVKYGQGTPNSVALFNAFAVNATYHEDETALLVNIGGENVDIAVQRGGELIFARNATPGGTAFTEAIKQAFATTDVKADKMKRAKGDVTPKGQAKYPDPTSEKVANAIMGTAGQLSSLIQSTLMIARAQTRTQDLKVDRVLLAGGGASLKGLDLYLNQAMGVPVERFNPFDLCDLSQLSAEEAALVEEAPHEFAVAVGLAQSDLSPAAFRLSVMPEAVRRARDFMTKGIFSVAAALVAGVILFQIYNARTASAAAFKKKKSSVKSDIAQAKKVDNKLRAELKKVQQEQVKHRLMAELAGPGALLAKVLTELEANASEHVYIYGVRLNVDKNQNTFKYFTPKGKAGSGYQEGSRTYGLTREPVVTVEARISGGQNSALIYQNFVDKLQSNKRGLVVTPEKLKGGKAGRDARFKMEIRPGVLIRPASEEGRSMVLREMRPEPVEEGEEPGAFVGLQSDGVQIRVPFSEVESKQLEELRSSN